MKHVNRKTGLNITYAPALALVIALAALTPLAADTIYTADGSRIENVKIIQAKWDIVTYTVSGLTQTVEGFKVVRLERPSRNLSSLVRLLQSGDFAAAETQIKRSRNLGIEDWEKAWLAYLEGQLYLDWASKVPSKAKSAGEAFTAYLNTYKAQKDFWVPHATYGIGMAYLAAGKPKSAVQPFQSLSEFGGSKGVWGPRASIGHAHALLAQVKGGQGRSLIPEIRGLFSKVVRDRNAPATVKGEALVGYAESFIAAEDYARARNEITQSFLKKNGDTEYNESYAQACNIMGQSYLREGGNENLERAEIWYLRTTCFFKRYPSVYREAAENLVAIYTKLNNTARAAEWKSRLD